MSSLRSTIYSRQLTGKLRFVYKSEIHSVLGAAHTNILRRIHLLHLTFSLVIRASRSRVCISLMAKASFWWLNPQQTWQFSQFFMAFHDFFTTESRQSMPLAAPISAPWAQRFQVGAHFRDCPLPMGRYIILLHITTPLIQHQCLVLWYPSYNTQLYPHSWWLNPIVKHPFPMTHPWYALLGNPPSDWLRFAKAVQQTLEFSGGLRSHAVLLPWNLSLILPELSYMGGEQHCLYTAMIRIIRVYKYI